MNKFLSKRRNCGLLMFILIIICELLLKIDNKFIQTIGIILTPFIVTLGFLLIKNDEKHIN